MNSILVYGGSGGIGSALIKQLASKDVRVWGSSRSPDRFDRIEESGGQPCLADTAQVESFAAAAATAQADAPLSGMACCIGSIFLKPAHLTKDEEWRETLNRNLDAAFYSLRACAPILTRNGGGAIVLVSSVAAGLGLPSHEAIAAAKAGIEGLARAAAASYASKKIRINCVAPSLTLTPMADRFPDNVKEASRQMHPLKKLGDPLEIAAAMAYLLDDSKTSWMTGQVLHLDGGMSSLKC